MVSRLFSDTMNLLEKSLDLRGRRHEILVSNITHQDTPGYQAQDIRFDDVLKTAVTGNHGELTRTDTQHFTGGTGSVNDPQGLVIPRESASGYDGNSVNVEQEMTQMAENSLMYNTSAQIISKKFQGLLLAIREGR